MLKERPGCRVLKGFPAGGDKPRKSPDAVPEGPSGAERRDRGSRGGGAGSLGPEARCLSGKPCTAAGPAVYPPGADWREAKGAPLPLASHSLLECIQSQEASTVALIKITKSSRGSKVNAYQRYRSTAQDKEAVIRRLRAAAKTAESRSAQQSTQEAAKGKAEGAAETTANARLAANWNLRVRSLTRQALALGAEQDAALVSISTATRSREVSNQTSIRMEVQRFNLFPRVRLRPSLFSMPASFCFPITDFASEVCAHMANCRRICRRLPRDMLPQSQSQQQVLKQRVPGLNTRLPEKSPQEQGQLLRKARRLAQAPNQAMGTLCGTYREQFLPSLSCQKRTAEILRSRWQAWRASCKLSSSKRRSVPRRCCIFEMKWCPFRMDPAARLTGASLV